MKKDHYIIYVIPFLQFLSLMKIQKEEVKLNTNIICSWLSPIIHNEAVWASIWNRFTLRRIYVMRYSIRTIFRYRCIGILICMLIGYLHHQWYLLCVVLRMNVQHVCFCYYDVRCCITKEWQSIYWVCVVTLV